MAVPHITTDQFDAKTSIGVAVVDFFATWCPPCKFLTPIIEKLGTEYEGQGDVSVMSVNVDDEPALAERFDIRGIPTVVIYKNGQEHTRLVGLQKEEIYKLHINEALTGTAPSDDTPAAG